jgi:hypothetical protein
MPRMTGPIESRCRLTSSPHTERERRPSPAATVTSKFAFCTMANLSRSRSSHPITGTQCPLAGMVPVGQSAAIGTPPFSDGHRADLGVRRSDEHSMFAISVLSGKLAIYRIE